ncbi:MAG: amidase [Gemmatimonadota bacterium]|nr:MAG: amidase [Gemmatimonadota bacterium]
MNRTPHIPSCPEPAPAIDWRQFMAYCSAIGLGGGTLGGALWEQGQEAGTITKEMLADAEAVLGLEFDADERELMLEGLNRNLRRLEQIRELDIANTVAPALSFDPVLPGRKLPSGSGTFRISRQPQIERPADLEAAAFWPVTHLAELVRTRKVTSLELTEMYLDRLKRHGPRLECIVTLTEELALKQAARADAEIARGHYRGPLHGIPWGAKDLLAEDQYRTTWGAKPFEDQVLDSDATVVSRLDEAGAVLVAKTTLGALAMGDVWFGGRTRNPWNLEQGSSGSSAGSAAATAAGLVGFSIGSETLGSIVSPSTRCGVTGLRPTFGRVSRYGAMALSWSMDKLGPICRDVEDCAIVLNAIHGADGKDPTTRDVPLDWDPESPLSRPRVGYYRSAFERDRRDKEFDDQVLAVLRSIGIEPMPIELPDQFPLGALRIILNAEAAAAFEELTRSNRDDLFVRQDQRAWPNSFRQSRLIPAVDYIEANRIRTMVMQALDAAMSGLDLFVTPTNGPNVLLMTNLTGHPSVTLPNGFREDGTPVSISFIGALFGEGTMLRVAKAYQDATDFHTRQPSEFAV